MNLHKKYNQNWFRAGGDIWCTTYIHKKVNLLFLKPVKIMHFLKSYFMSCILIEG